MDSLSLSQERVKKLTSGYAMGLTSNPALYHCSPTSKDGVIDLITKMTQCRETFLSYIRRCQLLERNRPGSYFTSKLVTSSFRFAFGNNCSKSPITNDVLNIKELAKLHKEFDDRTEQAVAVINMIEDHVGWKRTTVRRVNVGHRLDYFMYMFESSKRWNRSPHMASLLVYILREARMIELQPYDNINGAIKQIGGIASAYQDKWIVLLENFDKIFKDCSQTRMYSEKVITESTRERNTEWMTAYGKGITKSQLCSRICDLLYTEGIQLLCNGSSRYDVIGQRLTTFKRIKDNANKSKKSKNKKDGSSNCGVSYAA